MADKTKNGFGLTRDSLKLAVAVLLVVAFVALVSVSKNFILDNNTVKDIGTEGLSEEVYGEWLAGNDKCRCLEKERPTCSLYGFVYNETRNLCVNSEKKEVTYHSNGCSKYECFGNEVLWNGESWEPRLN